MEGDITDIIRSFPPVLYPDARFLVLGTVPSIKSLESGFYYGHPRNAFWHILSDITGSGFPNTIDEKKELLRMCGISLWDTVGECVREGSLDSAIRDACPNTYAEIETACPNIEKILLNGKTAAKLFQKNRFGAFPLAETIVMPSTSPAFTMRYEEKLDIWKNVLGYSKE